MRIVGIGLAIAILGWVMHRAVGTGPEPTTAVSASGRPPAVVAVSSTAGRPNPTASSAPPRPLVMKTLAVAPTPQVPAPAEAAAVQVSVDETPDPATLGEPDLAAARAWFEEHGRPGIEAAAVDYRARLSAAAKAADQMAEEVSRLPQPEETEESRRLKELGLAGYLKDIEAREGGQ